MTFRARLTIALAIVACGAAGMAAPRAVHAQAAKRQRDVVTRDELLESNQRDASLYAALRNLRPRFLAPPPGIRSLGNSATIPTAVIIDGKPMGGLETLESIVASTVDEVRYLEPSRAGTEYGSIAGGGAVVVKLWTPDRPARKPKRAAGDTTPTAPIG